MKSDSFHRNKCLTIALSIWTEKFRKAKRRSDEWRQICSFRYLVLLRKSWLQWERKLMIQKQTKSRWDMIVELSDRSLLKKCFHSFRIYKEKIMNFRSQVIELLRKRRKKAMRNWFEVWWVKYTFIQRMLLFATEFARIKNKEKIEDVYFILITARRSDIGDPAVL